jgi:hypothetical protein
MKIRDTIKNSINELKGHKQSHQAVSFRLSQNSDRCDTCKAYVDETPPHCQKVVDPIYDNAWCRDGHDIKTGRPFDASFED